MRGHRPAAETMDVVEHVADIARQRIARGRLQIQRNEVAVVRVDLNRIDDQDVVKVARRIGRARAIAVIRQDDEIQAGGSGSRGNLLDRSTAVGSRRMHVPRAHCKRAAVSGRGRMHRAWWQRREDKNSNGGHDDRRCQTDEDQDAAHGRYLNGRGYSPAPARSAAALSVRSQVNSGSVRPKCPNAAVLR